MAASQTGYTLAVVKDSYDVLGKTRTVVYDVTPTASSYYTTGYLIKPANVGLRTFSDVAISSQNPPSGTPLTTLIVPMFDIANNALQLFVGNSGGVYAASAVLSELASAGDASAYVFRIRFFGN